jgi:sec-independent protein translocase protein TatA
MLYQLSYSRVVGAARFERATPCSQSRCATGLRYAPGRGHPQATIAPYPKGVKAWYHDPMRLGPLEIVLILLVILLLFGAKKLPELARGIAQSAREFKKGLQEGEEKKEEPKA